MAKGKRKLPKDATLIDPVSYGETELAEELLLMIRKRVGFARDASISRIRLEMVTREQAEALIALLERVSRP
jgi:hypothetical protein